MEFPQVPEPVKAFIEAELEIFPSPRAQEARAWNFSKSQGPYKKGKFGIFLNPRNYMKAVLGIFLNKAHIDMGVPNPVY